MGNYRENIPIILILAKWILQTSKSMVTYANFNVNKFKSEKYVDPYYYLS